MAKTSEHPRHCSSPILAYTLSEIDSQQKDQDSFVWSVRSIKKMSALVNFKQEKVGVIQIQVNGSMKGWRE